MGSRKLLALGLLLGCGSRTALDEPPPPCAWRAGPVQTVVELTGDRGLIDVVANPTPNGVLVTWTQGGPMTPHVLYGQHVAVTGTPVGPLRTLAATTTVESGLGAWSSASGWGHAGATFVRGDPLQCIFMVTDPDGWPTGAEIPVPGSTLGFPLYATREGYHWLDRPGPDVDHLGPGTLFRIDAGGRLLGAVVLPLEPPVRPRRNVFRFDRDDDGFVVFWEAEDGWLYDQPYSPTGTALAPPRRIHEYLHGFIDRPARVGDRGYIVLATDTGALVQTLDLDGRPLGDPVTVPAMPTTFDIGGLGYVSDGGAIVWSSRTSVGPVWALHLPLPYGPIDGPIQVSSHDIEDVPEGAVEVQVVPTSTGGLVVWRRGFKHVFAAPIGCSR